MSTRLDDEFTVPVPVERVWEALRDARLVAACVPGATVESAEGGRSAGRLRVRIGSTTVTYRGEAEFTEADRAGYRLVVRASGREARGPGTASVELTARLHEAADGAATRVAVSGDLVATGRAAGFGPDVLAGVGARLLARFATRLTAELAEGDAADTAGTADTGEAGKTGETAPDAPAAMPEEVTAAERHGGAAAEARLEAAAVSGAVPESPASPAAPAPGEPASARPRGAAALDDEDDGEDVPARPAAAFPTAVTRALPVAAALVLLAAVLRWLIRRRR
ncbi:SRPBCC family protein [Streptomonospora sp. S1-112]|uniref:SRPBCC family protein n=1 Tax=Streptomonospora mangrovi TaxID=2883123 RepID=A0A9X3NRK2_9ACTN|nr:SRPBCC family protein [Streptomonospora mangrovi]MDA0567865.1 SRPBCC family protein [Streptomonospora mangrovi]